MSLWRDAGCCEESAEGGGGRMKLGAEREGCEEPFFIGGDGGRCWCCGRRWGRDCGSSLFLPLDDRYTTRGGLSPLSYRSSSSCKDLRGRVCCRLDDDDDKLNMKRERYILGVFEILRSSIFFVLESLDKPLLISDPELENHSALSSPNKKPSLLFSKKFPSSAQKPEDAWNIRILRDQFFRNTKLYEECLLSFMVRIEYKALNNIDINSIYTSASILVKILKNM